MAQHFILTPCRAGNPGNTEDQAERLRPLAHVPAAYKSARKYAGVRLPALHHFIKTHHHGNKTPIHKKSQCRHQSLLS